jgi:signal transduction histidine kinase
VPDLSLTDRSIAAVATARRKSFALRALHNAGFALSVALTTGNALAAGLWYLLIVALMLADLKAAEAYIVASPERRRTQKLLFVATSVSIVVAFMGMALSAALFGGEAGRLSAVFMAAASLITVMVLMVEAPLFLGLSALPGLALLALLPFAPYPPGQTLPVLGVILAIGVFASQLIRSAMKHVVLSAQHRRAREEAERRRAEAEMGRAEAERANRAKSEFLYAVTHELRTPLNAVINYAEIITEDAEGHIAEDAGRIRRSAHHLLSMIDRIITYSALESGRVHMTPERFCVGNALRQTIHHYRAAADAQGTRIALDGDAINLWSDPVHFSTCVDCLLSNAVKFSGGGLVSVSVRAHHGTVSVAVKDTGPGLSPELIETVFTPFTQSDGSRTRAVDGLGLGLAAARALARAMGGDINVESTLGRGACFTLRLPMTAHPAVSAAA